MGPYSVKESDVARGSNSANEGELARGSYSVNEGEVARGSDSANEGEVAIIDISGDGDDDWLFSVGSCNSTVFPLSSLVSLMMSV